VPTVDRVLPWRKAAPSGPRPPELDAVLSAYRARHPRRPTARIVAAHDMAAAAHEGQVRISGEAYVHHPLAVAHILAELGVGEPSIVAALLHDAVEDTKVTLAEITEAFDPEVASIVDGVTKLDRLHFETREAQQAASLRKMLLAVTNDPRVLLVKLADRLHNMRTIAGLPAAKRTRIATETLDIYAPLAHRLGLGEFKWQLEDLAFATLSPHWYAEIDAMVSTRAPRRQQYLDRVIALVGERLAELRITAEVTGRRKHNWSIYEKMVHRDKEFEEIHDLVGIRVVAGSVKDCYAALGIIHNTWTPLPGRFKDYIAVPKFNLYQSLHTTVLGPEGKPLEVQIRTREMHQRAEYGVAAHVGYKEGDASAAPWLNRLVDWGADQADPREFMETLKADLDENEVYVFTPKGDVVTLPLGATPIDFAYAIHTEVGHRCIGAKVDGRLAPIDSALASGQVVEVVTSKVEGAGPSRDWLKTVATARARTKIRQWFSRLRRSDAIDLGREELARELRRRGLAVQRLLRAPELAELAASSNYADVESLHAAIGEGHVSAHSVAQRLARTLAPADPAAPEAPAPAPGRRLRPPAPATGIRVDGELGMATRLSRCCTPMVGDPIRGFVTTGRGVSVHRSDCSNAQQMAQTMAEREIEVSWDREAAGSYVVAIEVEALDRTKLLRDVSAALVDHHVNILSCTTHTGQDRVARLRFEFELADPSHLGGVLRTIKGIDSVYGASRVLPGRRPDRGQALRRGAG